ncbi:LOW QUALITY PROTEIN: hypothetical protein V2J09_022628 [Rumex salicifolius]
MNDFEGLFSGDYGFKPQGKSAPMAPTRSNHGTANSSFSFDFDHVGTSSTTANKVSYSKSSASSVFLDDQGDFFSRSTNSATSNKNLDYKTLGGLDDLFGGSSNSPANSSVNLDSVFGGPADSASRFSSLPVYDKPVYDDDDDGDVFHGSPGLKSASSAKYENVFTSCSSPSSKKHDAFDYILGEFTRKEPESRGASGRKSVNNVPSFDDLLPGFGASAVPSDRNFAERGRGKRSTVNVAAKATNFVEVPFVVLQSDALSGQGLYTDPLEQFAELGASSGKMSENVSKSGRLFEDIDPLAGLGNSFPISTGTLLSSEKSSAGVEVSEKTSFVRIPPYASDRKMATEDYNESPSFDAFSASENSHRSAPNASSGSFVNVSDETASKKNSSTVYESNLNSSNDVWLTVSEIPLFTQPTVDPPPSRPRLLSHLGISSGSYPPPYAKKNIDEHPFPNSAQYFQTPKSAPSGGNSNSTSPIDELEDFAKGRSWNDSDGNSDVLTGDDLERHSDAAASAAAMKEAMDRAEAKFKHAKEVRERENAKAAKMQQVREDTAVSDLQERDFRELQERQEQERQRREEEKRKQGEEEERLRSEKEEREREQRRIEREHIERERARQAVERATREARERADADARARAEKAAVVKIQAEARERAERAAIMKAQVEARERAARAAVEAKKRADREKAEREAKEKESREKAAAAASARANQQKNESDLESIFGMGSRANSAPKARASASDPLFDTQFQKKQSGSVRTSVGSTASMRKTSSSANIVDDLSSIFGVGAPSAGDFQDVEGETEERRRARLERHQRTQERAAKALAEKNKRDLEAQNEQVERHESVVVDFSHCNIALSLFFTSHAKRIGETLDAEIKRWSAGKEGNLRALLSTMQYVLWPECGWNPVSLTDLITAVAVKKAYRKATLCIHPDKVQQKGATLQQKYIAEKVFDLLKSVNDIDLSSIGVHLYKARNLLINLEIKNDSSNGASGCGKRDDKTSGAQHLQANPSGAPLGDLLLADVHLNREVNRQRPKPERPQNPHDVVEERKKHGHERGGDHETRPPHQPEQVEGQTSDRNLDLFGDEVAVWPFLGSLFLHEGE